jgi:hypothetical protein
MSFRERTFRQRALAATAVAAASLIAVVAAVASSDSTDRSALCEEPRIASAADVRSTRGELVSYIWGSASAYPSDLRPQVSSVPIPPLFEGLTGIGRVEQLTFVQQRGLVARAYLLHAAKRTRRTLVVYQEGHVGRFAKGRPTIQFFLKHGYDVAAVALPLYRPNNRPNGWTDHARLNSLPRGGFDVFLDPTIGVLNQFAAQYGSVAMVGLSGGGWATVMAAALDRRVTRSYQVSGTLPHCMWHGTDANPLDYESTWPPLYARAGFLDLYVLGAEGRRQVQVQNVYDLGFKGRASKSYERAVNEALGRASGSGSFQAVLDTTIRKKHIISRWALEWILRDLRARLEATHLDLARFYGCASSGTRPSPRHEFSLRRLIRTSTRPARSNQPAKSSRRM